MRAVTYDTAVGGEERVRLNVNTSPKWTIKENTRVRNSYIVIRAYQRMPPCIVANFLNNDCLNTADGR